MNIMYFFKKITFFCVVFFCFANNIFAFTALNGDVSFDRLTYGNFYDYPGDQKTINYISGQGIENFAWKISGSTDLIKQYSITFQCAPVIDYSKAQSKYYSYTHYGQTNSFDWEVDTDSRNYEGAPKNCYCKASIIAQGDVDSLYGEPKPLGEAQTHWFRICEKPEIIKPWIRLLPIEEKDNGTVFNLELLSMGNDEKLPSILFKIFPRDILFEQNQKNVINIESDNLSIFPAYKGQWLKYFNTDDQEYRSYFSIMRNIFLSNDYCYQAKATNSRGETITPASCRFDDGKLIYLPKVANKSVVVSGNNTAYVTGSLINTGGSSKIYFWVLVKDYFDTKKPKKTFSSGTNFRATKVGNYQFKIAGLDANTSYCYYTTARNEAGFDTTDNSNTLDCFATPGKEWVKTLPSAYVEVDTRRKGGTKLFAVVYSIGAGNKNINLPVKAWFEYGLKENIPKDVSKIDLPEITEKISFQFNSYSEAKGKRFTVPISDKILSGKEYCYRAVVENSLGMKKKGNLECFSYGGIAAVESVPEGLNFVMSPDGSIIQKAVLKGNVVYPKNVEVAYFIWQKGKEDKSTNKTTYKESSGWTATTKIRPSNGDWSNTKNIFYGTIPFPKPGEKYCYKAVSNYNLEWITDYYPLNEKDLHCFVVPYRPIVKTFSADLGADLSIVSLKGKIEDAGYNKVWTDDGKYNIGQILYEKQIILERKNNPLTTDKNRLAEINQIFDSFNSKYCEGKGCGVDVYFNVYPNSYSNLKNNESTALKNNTLSQFATDTIVHVDLEEFGYQISNGIFKGMLAPYNTTRCVRYECNTKAWGGVCEEVIYFGNDCLIRKGNSACKRSGQYCSAIDSNKGSYCEWLAYDKNKEKCGLFQIVFPKGVNCPTTEQRCSGVTYEYKARAKNSAWYDISNEPKQFVIATESIPYGQSISFWDGCQRSNGELSTMRRSGCADTSMTMAIAYWYKNDNNVKSNWNNLIKKYFNQIRAWEKELDSDACRNPGLDYYTPNPFTFLYIARNATNDDGSIAYGAIGKNGQWNTKAMTRLLDDINIVPYYLTGSAKNNYLSFENAVGNLINGKNLVLRRPTNTVGGTGHWLYFDSYDPIQKTINGIDSWDGAYVSYTKSKYESYGFGREHRDYNDEIDNWALIPDRYPILSTNKEPDLLEYNDENGMATLKFWATIERAGSNNNEVEVVFYWSPVTAYGDTIINFDGLKYPLSSKGVKHTVASETSVWQDVENIKIKKGSIYCYWAKASNIYYDSQATEKNCFKITNDNKLEKASLISQIQE